MIPVIGAGVSGLAFAKTYGETTVFECSSGLGGRASSYYTDALAGRFHFDLGGHWFHFKSNPDVLSLLDGLAITQHTRYAHVYLQGNYVDFPLQKNYHQLNHLYPELVSTITGELAKLVPYQPSGNYDQMLRQSYGETLYTLFFSPYNRKMFGIDELNQLRVANLDVVRNVRLDQSSGGYNGDFVYPSGTAGAKAIPQHLAQGVDIRFRTELKSIHLGNKTIQLTQADGCEHCLSWADGLVTSIPLRTLINLISDVPPAITELAKSLRASPGCIINIGVKRLPIHGHKSWIYVADPDLSFYRFGFYSNVEPRLAPPGYVSMYAEVAPRQQYRSDADIQCQVLADLRKIGILNEEPVVIHLHRLAENYCLTNEHTISMLDFLRRQGIYSIGRYGAWRWSSQHEDIMDARELALQLKHKSQIVV